MGILRRKYIIKKIIRKLNKKLIKTVRRIERWKIKKINEIINRNRGKE